MKKFLKGALLATATLASALTLFTACGEQKSIEFKAEDGYLQWRYEGETSWQNVLNLDELKGGEKGEQGEQGESGKDGLSAYDIAVLQGFKGTEEEWIAALKGETGVNGKSAYEIAKENGFKGTEKEWLESLKGDNGKNGLSAYEIAVSKGYKGTEEQWLDSLKGAKGEDGKSVYEVAKALGFKGTEQQWLDSLKGAKGDDGFTPYIGDNGNWWIDDTDTNVPASSEEVNMDGAGTDGLYFQMTIRGGVAGYEVNGYSGMEKDIVIPNEIFGKPVVSIKQGALPTSMTSLKISSNTEYLPTFQDYNYLTEVDFNKAPIAEICDNAFKGSESLRSLKNYENITKIGSYAFYQTQMWEFDFKNITSIGSYAFYELDDDFWNEITETGKYEEYSLKNNNFVYLPKTVTEIGVSAFDAGNWLPVYYEGEASVEYTNSYFYTFVQHDSNGYYYRDMGTYVSLLNYDGTSKKLTVPATLGGKSVKSVEKYAFVANAKVERVELPSSVTSVGNYAFAWCMNLHSLFIPDSVTACGDYIGTSDDDWGVTEITTVFFEETEFNFEGGATIEDLDIFKYMIGIEPAQIVEDDTCVYLKKTLSYQVVTIKLSTGEVNIPSAIGLLPVTQINKYAFCWSNYASVVNIPKSITDISKYAFYSNSHVRIINIPKSDNDVNQYGFYSLSNCTIFVEESAKPENWDSSWYSSVGKVVYGSQGTYGIVNGAIYLYETADGKVYLKEYLGAYTEGMTLTVPEKIDGKTVYGVRQYCYEVPYSVYGNSSSRLKIVIPKSITVMESYAINCYTGSSYCYANVYLDFADSSAIPSTWSSSYIYRGSNRGTTYYASQWEMIDGVPTVK